MITTLIIENYKLIRRLELDLRPFTVLIGPNDSGKSSILQALNLLGASMTTPLRGTDHSLFLREDDLERVLPGRDRSCTLRITARGEFENGQYEYSLGVGIEAGIGARVIDERLLINRTPIFVYQGTRGTIQVQATSVEATADRSLLSQLRKENFWEPLERELRGFAVHFDPRKLATPSELSEELQDDGSGLASLIDELLTSADRQPLKHLESQLARISPHVRQLGTAKTKFRRGSFEHSGKELVFLTDTNVSIPASQMSTGILLATAFLGLVHKKGYKLFLVEEPENGIHPRVAGEVVRILRELTLEGRQVIATTHSPLLLNHMDPEDVIVVTRSEAGVTGMPILRSKHFEERSEDFDLGELWYNIGEREMVGGS